jgi:chemotaxis protein MotB
LTNLYQKDTTERGIQYRALDSTHRHWLAAYDALNNQYVSLDAKHTKLQSDYREMNDKYTQLIQNSLSKTEQLNLALNQKVAELEERERKLSELRAMLHKQDSLTQALNAVIKKALLSFNSDEITVEMKEGKVYVSMTDKLLFRSGSAEVEDKGKGAIKTLADILNKNADVSITIEGHTDNVPIKTAMFKDNWDLSVARATNIVRLLDETYKVNAKRLTSAGRGEYVPKAANETAEGRAKNRRTEIILTPKLDELYKIVGW